MNNAMHSIVRKVSSDDTEGHSAVVSYRNTLVRSMFQAPTASSGGAKDSMQGLSLISLLTGYGKISI